MQTVDEEEDGESVSSSSSSLSRAHAKGQTPSDSVVQHCADESGEVRQRHTHSAPEQTVIHVVESGFGSRDVQSVTHAHPALQENAKENRASHVSTKPELSTQTCRSTRTHQHRWK